MPFLSFCGKEKSMTQKRHTPVLSTCPAPGRDVTLICGPEPPAGLGDAGRAEWLRVTAILRERGSLDALDQTAIGDYAQCFDRVLQCEAQISEHGLLVDGRDGGSVKNPLLATVAAYRAALQNWCKVLGLSPAGRRQSGVTTKPLTEKNRFNRLAGAIQ
jgi:P27 family predicted phage terminase small subunit